MNCTGEILDCGCIGHCGNYVLDLNVPNAGTYLIEYEYLNVRQSFEVNVQSDNDKLIINASNMPVNHEIIFSILNTDTLENIEIGEYSLFRIKTNVRINTDIQTVASPDAPSTIVEVEIPQIENGQT